MVLPEMAREERVIAREDDIVVSFLGQFRGCEELIELDSSSKL